MSPSTALVAGLAAVLSALALAAPSALGSAAPRDDAAPAKASTASSSGVPLCC